MTQWQIKVANFTDTKRAVKIKQTTCGMEH